MNTNTRFLAWDSKSETMPVHTYAECHKRMFPCMLLQSKWERFHIQTVLYCTLQSPSFGCLVNMCFLLISDPSSFNCVKNFKLNNTEVNNRLKRFGKTTSKMSSWKDVCLTVTFYRTESAKNNVFTLYGYKVMISNSYYELWSILMNYNFQYCQFQIQNQVEINRWWIRCLPMCGHQSRQAAYSLTKQQKMQLLWACLIKVRVVSLCSTPLPSSRV